MTSRAGGSGLGKSTGTGSAGAAVIIATDASDGRRLHPVVPASAVLRRRLLPPHTLTGSRRPSRVSVELPELPPLTRQRATVRGIDHASGVFPRALRIISRNDQPSVNATKGL